MSRRHSHGHNFHMENASVRMQMTTAIFVCLRGSVCGNAVIKSADRERAHWPSFMGITCATSVGVQYDGVEGGGAAVGVRVD